MKGSIIKRDDVIYTFKFGLGLEWTEHQLAVFYKTIACMEVIWIRNQKENISWMLCTNHMSVQLPSEIIQHISNYLFDAYIKQ